MRPPEKWLSGGGRNAANDMTHFQRHAGGDKQIHPRLYLWSKERFMILRVFGSASSPYLPGFSHIISPSPGYHNESDYFLTLAGCNFPRVTLPPGLLLSWPSATCALSVVSTWRTHISLGLGGYLKTRGHAGHLLPSQLVSLSSLSWQTANRPDGWQQWLR